MHDQRVAFGDPTIWTVKRQQEVLNLRGAHARATSCVLLARTVQRTVFVGHALQALVVATVLGSRMKLAQGFAVRATIVPRAHPVMVLHAALPRLTALKAQANLLSLDLVSSQYLPMRLKACVEGVARIKLQL